MAPTIVVGIEDSFRAQDAVALAGDLARPAGAEVLAVGAFCFDDRPSEHFNLALREPLREAAELTLDRLCEPLSDLPVRRLAVPDPSPARALLRVAEEADARLIVVGSSHGRFTGRISPGSTGRRLLAGAPCPVALAPQGHRMRPHLTWGRVTAAFDGSPGSYTALAEAAALASATSRMLRVVRVFAPDVALPPWLNSAPGYLRVMPEARQAAEEEVFRAAASFPGAEPGFLVGDPAEELARESELSDLIVLGSRGYGPADRVSLGHVGERLLHGSACPALVVPNGAVAPLVQRCGKVLTGSVA